MTVEIGRSRSKSPLASRRVASGIRKIAGCNVVADTGSGVARQFTVYEHFADVQILDVISEDKLARGALCFAFGRLALFACRFAWALVVSRPWVLNAFSLARVLLHSDGQKLGAADHEIKRRSGHLIHAGLAADNHLLIAPHSFHHIHDG